MMKAALLAVCALSIGCGSRSGLLSPEPLERARADAGMDDAGMDDGGSDAGTDAGIDADVIDPPPPPPDIEATIQVSAGLFHTCAATRVGRVHCWGFNNLGQLGDGTNETRREPVPHAGVNDAIAIASGREHGCAIRGDRTVSCWGSNIARQLGDGTDEFRRLSPVRVVGLSDVIDLAAGGEHTCARTADERLYCWGRSFEATPERIGFVERVLEVAGGYRHTCARLASGQVSCWGSTSLGGTSRGATDPDAFVHGLPPVVAITSGDSHSCGIEASGEVWCWGFETYDVHTDDPDFPVQTYVRPANAARVAIDDGVQISAGHEFTCVVREGGRVTCWGNNERGQLGDGGRDQTGAFVDPIGVERAIYVSAGWRHACALEDNGVVMCWGRNTEGQLGEGTSAENHEPVMAAVLAD